MSDLNIPFLFQPSEQLICAGQPDAAALKQVAEAGIKTVINLRPDAEMDWDEAGLLSALGLEYLQLPVASPADLNRENAERLGGWIRERNPTQILVHCASSNRVGALLALDRFLQGDSIEDALSFGRASGMTRMEGMVAAILSQWQQA